jgi:hypothetical protein
VSCCGILFSRCLLLNKISGPATAENEAAYLNQLQHLRQWQTQQQTWLLRQQEEQLALLHNEQHRVQRMIAQQRQNIWGQTNGWSCDSYLCLLHFSHCYLGLSTTPSISEAAPRAAQTFSSTMPPTMPLGAFAQAENNGPQPAMQAPNERTPQKLVLPSLLTCVNFKCEFSAEKGFAQARSA